MRTHFDIDKSKKSPYASTGIATFVGYPAVVSNLFYQIGLNFTEKGHLMEQKHSDKVTFAPNLIL